MASLSLTVVMTFDFPTKGSEIQIVRVDCCIFLHQLVALVCLELHLIIFQKVYRTLSLVE